MDDLTDLKNMWANISRFITRPQSSRISCFLPQIPKIQSQYWIELVVVVVNHQFAQLDRVQIVLVFDHRKCFIDECLPLIIVRVFSPLRKFVQRLCYSLKVFLAVELPQTLWHREQHFPGYYLMLVFLRAQKVLLNLAVRDEMSLVSFENNKLQASLENVFDGRLINLIDHLGEADNPQLVNSKVNELFVVHERLIIHIDLLHGFTHHLSDQFSKT